MDQLAQMRTFVRVVDAGGFAAAARDLGLSRSVVNRAIIALEQQLGTALLHRSTRQVSPTDRGQLLYERCQPILAQVDEALGAVTELQDTPTGTLRVNAPMSLGTLHLSAMAARFMAAYPSIRLELALGDRQVDPIEEGFDVTVRVGRQAHSTSLASTPLGAARVVACASPGYLARAGTPAAPSALRQHRCLHYGYQSSGSQWRFRSNSARDQTVSINCVMWSNNGEVLRDAAIADQGIALLPTFIVGEAIQAKQLEVVLSDYEMPPLPLSLLCARHRQQSKKVQLFAGFIEAELAAKPAWAMPLSEPQR